MKRIVTSYDMMIAGPDDTKEEVEAVFDCVKEFNRQTESAIMVRIRYWSDDVYMDSNKKIQESINEQIVADCDFAVAVFKERLGTPTGEFESRTAQEIQLFREQHKQVFVFCSEEALKEDGEKTELQKYIAKLKFAEEKEEIICVKPYDDPQDLSKELLKQLLLFGAQEQVPALQQAMELKIDTLSVGKADHQKLSGKIKNARHVKLFQTTGRALIHAYAEQLAGMLGRNGTLQVLLPNPESEFLHDVDLVEGRGIANPISREFYATLDDIRRIWEKAGQVPGNTRGKILIGCARTMLRQTEIICIDKEDDKDDKQIWCWVTMTLPPNRAAGNSLSLESQTTEKEDGSLADWANTNFNRSWEESDVVIEFDGTQEIPYFYMEKSHAMDFWREQLDNAKSVTCHARTDSRRDGILIEISAPYPLKEDRPGTGFSGKLTVAQYPLEKDGRPGAEFSRRLDMGYDLYRRMEEHGIRCRIYVPGSRHTYQDTEDRYSLSEAGTAFLTKKGIPPKDIYGEPENARYGNEAGVYNMADECFVASRIWDDELFAELYCVCSPIESMRKTAHYIALGILPSVYCCPSPAIFPRRVVEEMFEALPGVLYENPYPGFVNMRDISGNAKD